MNATDDSQPGDDLSPSKSAESDFVALGKDRDALTLSKMRLLMEQQERRIAAQFRAEDSMRTRATLLITASAITSLLRSMEVESVWALLAIIAGLVAAFAGIYGLRRFRRKGFDPSTATTLVTSYNVTEARFMRQIFESEQQAFKEFESVLATCNRVVQIGFASLAMSMLFAFISLLDRLI